MNMKIPLMFGNDTNGNSFYSDLATIPHILITGNTGSGKTTLLNSFIISILKLDECKLTLIDTQGINFDCWDSVANVVIGADDAISALESVHNEMERRHLDGKSENTPYSIIIIDELADLIGAGDDKVVRLINSIAQKGRAVGVHLIMATQRQDKIPNDILNVIPTQATFQLNDINESKRILGISGAESLLSRGDILYSDMGRTLIRIHTKDISKSEIQNIVHSFK